MAYLQVDMKQRVFVKLPDYWAAHMPADLKDYCGVPLLLLKALYGYTSAASFFTKNKKSSSLTLGCGHLQCRPFGACPSQGGGILLVLQYSDDFLISSTDTIFKSKFQKALSNRFEIEWNARIRQDSDGNISLDQQRYAKSVVG